MSGYRDQYEHGARVITVRASATFFAKGQPGTVEASSRDGNYQIRFDDGGAWWLHEDEFKRMPTRRRRVSVFERLAVAFAALRGKF